MKMYIVAVIHTMKLRGGIVAGFYDITSIETQEEGSHRREGIHDWWYMQALKDLLINSAGTVHMQAPIRYWLIINLGPARTVLNCGHPECAIYTSIRIMELVILNVVTLKMWKWPWDETVCMESNYKLRACPHRLQSVCGICEQSGAENMISKIV